MTKCLGRVLVAGILIAGMRGLAESEDWQLWSEQGITGAFDDQWGLTLRQEEKWSDQQGGLVEYNVDLGLGYKATPHWILGLNYRQAYGKKGTEWFEENRPHLNVTYKTKLKKFTVSDRTRLELRMTEVTSDIVRFRNKLTVQCNEGFGGWNPYVADEIFIDSVQGNLNRNRFYIGLKGKPASKVKAEIYGLWQSTDRGPFWREVFALGVKAYATF